MTSISRRNKGCAWERLVTFTYDSSYYLTKITDAYGRETSFTYANGFLTKVTFPDGKTAEYSYTDSGKLNDAYDGEANYGIEYGIIQVPDIGETLTTVREY